MAKKSMGIKVLNFILTLVILLGLVSVGTVTFFNFSLIGWLSFGMKWLEYVIAGIVSGLGLIGLIALFVQTLFK